MSTGVNEEHIQGYEARRRAFYFSFFIFVVFAWKLVETLKKAYNIPTYIRIIPMKSFLFLLSAQQVAFI